MGTFRFVEVGVKPAVPGEARNAGQGGPAVGAAKEEETKRRGGYQRWPATVGALANVGEDVGT